MSPVKRNKKDKGLMLSLREKRQLYSYHSRHPEENIHIRGVVEDLVMIIECKNIDMAESLYNNTLRKTATLSVSNGVKQDLFGLSHVAYIHFLSSNIK